MNSFVIDAYAWIEYFNGTKQGEKVKNIIENPKNKIFTNAVTVAELASSYRRNKLNFDEEKRIILDLSKIYNINLEFAEEAGRLHANIKKERKKIGMADVFILLTAKKLKAKVVTCDEDFIGLKEVFMLK